MSIDNLSKEAYQTILGMVEFCLEHGYCMGMDEGFAAWDEETGAYTLHPFRAELEALVKVSSKDLSIIESVTTDS